MKEKMIKLNHYYLLYKEERSYTKKVKFAKIRKCNDFNVLKARLVVANICLNKTSLRIFANFTFFVYTEEIVKWIRMNSRQASDFTTLKTDIDRMKEKMIGLLSLTFV
jgi:uncharacterized membrane protein YgaE (UPF0421/DUF939 family)